jgi:aminopeptidase-like protein
MIEKLAAYERDSLEQDRFGVSKAAQAGQPAASHGSGTALAPRREAPHLASDSGGAMHSLIKELYPICRSITGDGVRATLGCLAPYLPLEVVEIPTGTQVLDWTIPREWNIRDAFIKRLSGERVVDFGNSNLHVVGYSAPVCALMSLADLRSHLHTLPARPDWIPYRTSYYAETWGFCLSHNQFESLGDEVYEVCIDSTLEDGSLTYGECLIEGESSDEVLISCHVCHPSLCNDNLSGIVVAAALAQELSRRPTRYSYRFVFVPGTIGAITWLARNRSVLERVKHGLVLTCLGDAGRITYKKSRGGDAEIDRAVAYVLQQKASEFAIRDFSPDGYDERQYGSPGFNLPVGCLMRTPHGVFPEYHTSADDPDFVRPAALADSARTCLEVIDVIENNRIYRNLQPFGEPQLGRRGLYESLGGQVASDFRLAMLWLLNMSDGTNSLLDVAAKAGLPWRSVKEARRALCQEGLLEVLDQRPA